MTRDTDKEKGIQMTPIKKESVEIENLHNSISMLKSCQTNLQPKSKKEKIIYMFYEEKIKQEKIASEIGCSQQYVSKIIKKDNRYIQFKGQQKLENAENNINLNIVKQELEGKPKKMKNTELCRHN